MVLDSDPITQGRCPDDLASVVLDAISCIQFKLFGLMLVVFIILSSDVFINRVLSKFNGAVDYKCPTSYGTWLQGLFLVIACVIIDVAIKQNVI
jgi:hypothetical protein